MSDADRQAPISVTGLLPVSPSLSPTLQAAHVPQVSAVVGPRVIFISALSIGVAFVAGLVARVLVAMIACVTNAAFLGRFIPGDGTYHPFKYVCGQLSTALRDGIGLYTRTKVFRIDSVSPDDHRLVTDRGTISARRVIVATNAFTPDLLPELPSAAPQTDAAVRLDGQAVRDHVPTGDAEDDRRAAGGARAARRDRGYDEDAEEQNCRAHAPSVAARMRRRTRWSPPSPQCLGMGRSCCARGAVCTNTVPVSGDIVCDERFAHTGRRASSRAPTVVARSRDDRRY